MTVASPPAPAESVPRREAGHRVGPFLVFLVLVGATVPWRPKNYFEGAVDSIVLAKAGLSLFALVLAVLVSARRPTRPLRASPFVFLLLYLACTVLGGWSDGIFLPSAVVAVRVMLLAVAVAILSRHFDGAMLLGALVAALATFGVAGSITGIPTLSEGRLSGGLPPLHPNELASTCALVILWCLWRLLAGQDTALHLVGIAVALAVLLATGSRTALVSLVIGAVLLALHATAVRIRTLLMAMVIAPVLLWVVAGTSLVTNLLTRHQGSADLTTLSNRTIAWQAALAPKNSPWLEWLGAGLTMKKVEVRGQLWREQILDSSWVSALVQGGLIGLAICVVWFLYSLAMITSSPRRLRALQLAIVAYLASRGVLESGLFDATTSFLVFFLALMATPLESRRPLPDGSTRDTTGADPGLATAPERGRLTPVEL